MDGNCALAHAGVGKNEYYPCIPETQDYGIAITGNADEVLVATASKGASTVPTVGLALAVDRFDERVTDFARTCARGLAVWSMRRPVTSTTVPTRAPLWQTH
jgi:hypothetical protein